MKSKTPLGEEKSAMSRCQLSGTRWFGDRKFEYHRLAIGNERPQIAGQRHQEG